MSIEHDRDAHRFTSVAPSGTAILAYAPAGAGVVELYSTYVPHAERGKGLAGRLVEAAVEYARSEGLRIIPSCWYVAQWIEQHPEHRDLLST
ncbi:MAG: N-acetyltransferase [Gemmatimonadales bacterium]|nr:N-acetyltransferase [Gemmatimonadales bacterium]